MKARTSRLLLFCLIATLLAVNTQARAETDTERVANSISEAIAPMLLLGELSLLTGGDEGKKSAVEGLKVLAVNQAVTEALKQITREKRPESPALNSFPSGHTSAAFAMASKVAEHHPRYSGLAYGAAALMGVSRIAANAHHWQDVVAGAALGLYIARNSEDEHLQISPTSVSYSWKW